MRSWRIAIWLNGLRVRIHVVQLGPDRFVAQSYDGAAWGDGTTAELAVARTALRLR